jgi:hypothetical protein
MIVLAACYFVAGLLAGPWMMHLASPQRAEDVSPSAAAIRSIPAPVASTAAATAVQLANPLNRFSDKVVSIVLRETISLAVK